MTASKNVTKEVSIPGGRARLANLIRQAGDVVTIDDAVKDLSLSRTQASKLLSRWTEQGWLRRIKAGTYVAANLDSLDREKVLDDPFVLVPHIFGKSYIGGRTAAHYWDLTEQLFRDVVVFTADPARESERMLHGVPFTVFRLQEKNIFGVKSLWRGRTRVSISDVHRTIIDILDNPESGGGAQQVNDCLLTYLKSSDYDLDLLIAYGDQLGNGAVFKRLGFLAERSGAEDALIEACRNRLTSGNAKLDPALDCSKLVTRWRLLIPESWAAKKRDT